MPKYNDPENTVVIESDKGQIVMKLLPEIAPKHCARFKDLVRQGAYDGVCFHRVIAGFMAQTGDVKYGKKGKELDLRCVGTGGSDLPDLPSEFSSLPHIRGSVGAARSQHPDSANSQFFINYNNNDFLNGQYTVFGQVIEGMACVDMLEMGEPPIEPSWMQKLELIADMG